MFLAPNSRRTSQLFDREYSLRNRYLVNIFVLFVLKQFIKWNIKLPVFCPTITRQPSFVNFFTYTRSNCWIVNINVMSQHTANEPKAYYARILTLLQESLQIKTKFDP